MAEFTLPRYGVEYILYVSLVDAADTTLIKANPTLASGDVKISKDGGAEANLNTLPAATPASGRHIKVTVSAAEMTADNVSIVFHDASGAEWCDLQINIQPGAIPTAVHKGLAQAGANGTVTLASTASATNDLYNDMVAVIVAGTGSGQARLITDYDGTSKVADVTPNWTTNPDTDSLVQLVPTARVDLGRVTGATVAAAAVSAGGYPQVSVKEINDIAAAAARLALGAQAGVPGTVDDADFSPTTTEFESDDITNAAADFWNGATVIFTSGALLGQRRPVSDYAKVGTKGHFTVSPALTSAPADAVTFILV